MEVQITWMNTLLKIKHILPGFPEDFQVAKRIFSIEFVSVHFIGKIVKKYLRALISCDVRNHERN